MKKKLFIIPVTLLLLLLYASYGTAYADTCKTWTEEDLKNVIYNMYTANTNYDMKTAIDKLVEDYYTNFTTILNAINNYDYIAITIRNDSSPTMDFQLFNTSNMQNTHPYISRNCLTFMNTPTGTGYRINYNSQQQTWTYSNTNINTAGSFQHQTNTRYFSTTIYSGGNSNTILYSPQYYTPSNLFDGPYNQMLFIFMAEPTETIVDVDIFEDIPAYNYNINQNMTIGTLYVPYETEITDFSLLRGYYTGDYWKYVEVTTEYPNNIIYYKRWSEGDDFISYDIIMNKQYIQQNNIYIITWSDQTEEPYQNATGTFFIKNGQTVIVNGEVIPSGDKITGQIGELQEDINKNNDFWKNTYNRLMQPSGEVIRNEFENLIKEVEWTSGDVSGELAEALAGLDVINNNPGDFIIAWSPTRSKLSIGGQQLQNQLEIGAGQINFSQMERDSEELQDVMFYARAILSFAIFVMFGRNLWRTLLRTFGIDTSIYDTTTPEQKIAQMNEENWKNQLEKQKYNEWLRNHRK